MLKPKRTLWAELAFHLAMGACLGLMVVTFILLNDTLHVAAMIIDSAEPQLTMLIFTAIFVLVFAMGAALTGLIFIVAER